MKKLDVGSLAPPFPMVELVIRAYKKWEIGKVPQEMVRVGASTKMIQKLRHLCLTTTHLPTIQDLALVVLPIPSTA